MLKQVKSIARTILNQNLLLLVPNKFNNLNLIHLLNYKLLYRCGAVTPLCKIMKEEGTDKALYAGNGKHNYTPIYHYFFKNLQKKEINLFELGIGTTNLSIEANMGIKGRPGASLRGWKKYFQNGLVYGADIDKSILFEEERIKTFYCDQTNVTVISELWKQLPQSFDIIIDDGLHEFDANVVFLENSISKVSKNGFFIIEDVKSSLLDKWDHYLKVFCQNQDYYTYFIFKIPNRYNKFDNNVIMILVKDRN